VPGGKIARTLAAGLRIGKASRGPPKAPSLDMCGMDADLISTMVDRALMPVLIRKPAAAGS
jgi:hypothetical protein